MRVVTVREGAISLQSEIRNAAISFADMDTSVVAVITDVVREGRPVIGYGFNTNGRYAVRGILQRRLIPRLLAADPLKLLTDDGSNFDPRRVRRVLMQNEKPGGHGERAYAVAALDMAIFDAVAKIAGLPLAHLIARERGEEPPTRDVSVYAAGGYYYPSKSVIQLQDEVRRYLELGYTLVKIKIGGAPVAEDCRRIEAVISVVGDGARVAVDANGRLDLATALAYAEALVGYGLLWFEEPGDPLDYSLQAELATIYDPPLATGENLFSVQDARNLIRHGGMRPDRDILQFDPALAYGLVEYADILAMLAQHGWVPARCSPHGGHQFALHITAGFGLGGTEAYPGVFAPIGGFADGVPVVDGRVRVPDEPGIGVELKSDLHRVFKDLVAD